MILSQHVDVVVISENENDSSHDSFTLQGLVISEGGKAASLAQLFRIKKLVGITNPPPSMTWSPPSTKAYLLGRD